MTIIIRLGLYIYINMYTVYIYRLPPFYFIPHGVRINQYLDLFELQRLHRKIHRSRAVQEKNWNEKTTPRKNQPAKCILSQLGVRHHPAQFILRIRQTLSHSFASSPWGSALNLFELFFGFRFFFGVQKKLSQLDATKLDRCGWASVVLLR